jgi:large subunit ribosomal protein L29
MKKSDIKSLDNDALKAALQTEKNRLTKMKFAHAITPLENPAQLKALRVTVARLHTEIRTRQLSA